MMDLYKGNTVTDSFGQPVDQGAGHGHVAPFFPPVGPLKNMPPGPGGTHRYREMTIDEMLLENRVLFLFGEIMPNTSMPLIMRMLYLQNTKKDQDIHLYINSPGGSVTETLAIYDTMRFLSCDIHTYCIGMAMSGGSVILSAGTKGKRYILPHAEVMIHQPSGGIYGQTSDVKIQITEMLKKKQLLAEVLAKHTGQTPEKILEDGERDKFFNAEEALEYGLVDQVLEAYQDKKEREEAEKAEKEKGESTESSEG